MTKQEPTFEIAYKRLEEILEKLNNPATPLEDAIKLYEEADKLIKSCSNKLAAAEQKIQMIVKDSSGAISTDNSMQPNMQSFSPSQEQYIQREPTRS